MSTNFKKIDNINLISLGDHAVLFYEEDEELLSVPCFYTKELKKQ